MHRIFWIFLFVFCSYSFCGGAQASSSLPGPDFTQVRCESEVKTYLSKLESLNQWQRQVDPMPRAKSFRSRTKNFGTWIEVHLLPGGTTEVHKFSQNNSERTSWDKTCKVFNEKTEDFTKISQEGGKKYFYDSDLLLLMRSKKTSLVYIWSPGMTYSMEALPIFQLTSKKLGLQFIPLMDPFAEQEKAMKLAAYHKIPLLDRRVESVELLMRNTTVHFPTVILISKGRITDTPIVGALSPEELRGAISRKLASLEK